MKRKLSVVLFMMALVGVCLAGCGSKDGSTSGDGKSKDKDTIAFSELFEEDVIVYHAVIAKGKSFAGKDAEIENVYSFKSNGEYNYWHAANGAYTIPFGEFGKLNTDEEVLDYVKFKDETYAYKLGVNTDSTGNNTESEVIFRQTENDSSEYEINSFAGHTELYDNSYMTFYGPGRNGSTYVYLIKDTDKTKDKTVVFDSADNGDMLVDLESAKDAFK